MKVFILLALLGACFAEIKDDMLASNRIDSEIQTSTTCLECQSIIKRFVEASHDEKKMNELTEILKLLCAGTKYQKECVTAAESLRFMIRKLEPYLSDAARVCKSFHLCSNSRLEAFHRIGLLYAKKALDQAEGENDLACDECKFAALELKKIVEDKEKQRAIKEFFSKSICIHAASYRGMCDMLVEQFLPSFFEQLDSYLQDTKQCCAMIGFCPSKRPTARLTPIPHGKSSLRSFFAGAKTIKTSQGLVLKTCVDCEVECDGLLEGAIAIKNEIADTIQGTVCNDLLPANFTASCQDFMSLYLPTVVFMTIKQYNPHQMCVKKDLCPPQSAINMAALSREEKLSYREEACLGTYGYLKTSLLEKEVQHNAVAAVHADFCQQFPFFWIEACYSLTSGMIPRFFEAVSMVIDTSVMCKAH